MGDAVSRGSCEIGKYANTSGLVFLFRLLALEIAVEEPELLVQNMKLDIIGIISICKNSNRDFNMYLRLCVVQIG